MLNASLDMENEQIIYKDYVNIGVAVDTDRGLVVPALRDADRLSIPDIARALATIADNARNNKFTVDDLRGSTFSISNLGRHRRHVLDADHQLARKSRSCWSAARASCRW